MAGIAEQLRQAVLLAAIQGKLTEQLPEDGNARDLLAEIQAEKAKLIAEKKIKKEKPLEPISDDEIPFDIPDNWLIVKFSDVFYKITDGTHKTPKYVTNGIPFISVKNISTGQLSFSDIKYITKSEHEELYSRCDPEQGDILISKVGTTGVPVIVNTNEQFSLFVSVALLKYVHHLLDGNYLVYAFKSPYVYQQSQDNTRGVGNKNWVLDAIKNTCFPLPPLAEQHRIVARVDELMAKIDELEKVENELNALHKAFPGDMKAALLQAAMQGKLTEQLPEDGNAENLLKSIEAEKGKLVAEKKIKKQKALEPIADDEIPFEIPDNWKWNRLRNLVYNRGQKTPVKEFSYIDIGSIDNIHQRLNDNETIIPAAEAPSRARKIVGLGDILYSTVRPYLHNACIIDKNFRAEPIASTGFAVLTCYKGVNSKYLLYYMLSPAFDQYANATDNAKGVAYPAINDEKLYKAVVPLPPLAEQQRIVEKLDKLLPLCVSLEERL